MSQPMSPCITKAGPEGQGSLEVSDPGSLALRRGVGGGVSQSGFHVQDGAPQKATMETCQSQDGGLAFRSPKLTCLKGQEQAVVLLGALQSYRQEGGEVTGPLAKTMSSNNGVTKGHRPRNSCQSPIVRGRGVPMVVY